MSNFIKRIFGIGDDSPEPNQESSNKEFLSLESTNSADKYFEILPRLQEAITKHKFDLAVNLTIKSINLIPSLVSNEISDYGSFRIASIPAFEQGGTVLALFEMEKELIKMRDLIYSSPSLEPWRLFVNNHIQDSNLIPQILKAVKENPGCLQTDMKNLIGQKDGHRVSNLLHWLDKADKITRTKKGRTYSITLPEESISKNLPPKRKVQSHRIDKKAPRCQELNLENVPFVSLPRAPNRWEELNKGNRPKPFNDPSDWFKVRDTNQWIIKSITEIPTQERPDPAFRQIYPLDNGILMIHL